MNKYIPTQNDLIIIIIIEFCIGFIVVAFAYFLVDAENKTSASVNSNICNQNIVDIAWERLF